MDIVFHLKRRKLIRGFQAHINDGLSGAADYEANYEDLYSNVAGKALLFGDEKNTGGFWVGVTDALGRSWQHAHLSERHVKTGQIVLAGQLLGKTGNTGTVTTSPHDHTQIVLPNGQRVDPVPLLTNAPFPTMAFEQYNEKIIRNIANGSYALVVRGKKFVIQSTDAAAIFTWMQRNTMGNFAQVDNVIFDSIPNSAGLRF